VERRNALSAPGELRFTAREASERSEDACQKKAPTNAGQIPEGEDRFRDIVRAIPRNGFSFFP
jgi:hypothetical protein